MSLKTVLAQIKGSLVNRLNDLGVPANIESGWTSIINTSQNTHLTIETPLTLIYSDNFNINGILETNTYRRISNKTIKLKVDNEIVATTTTNSNGEYSFTQTPVTMGNHSFQTIFEGTSIYNSSNSTIINREIGKEVSILSVTPMTTQHIDTDTVFNGTLLTDDGEAISSATIKFYRDNELMGTATTDSSGNYSYTMEVE